MLNFIGVQTTNKIAKAKKKLDEERRAALKNKNDVEYSACCVKMLELKEGASQSLMNEVCDAISIDFATFMNSLQMHA